MPVNKNLWEHGQESTHAYLTPPNLSHTNYKTHEQRRQRDVSEVTREVAKSLICKLQISDFQLLQTHYNMDLRCHMVSNSSEKKN